MELIRAQGAEPAGVVIMLDRMERTGSKAIPTRNGVAGI